MTASRLDWDEPRREGHREMLEWYRLLLRLRRELPEVVAAPLEPETVRYDAQARTVSVRRGPVAVVANLGDEVWRASAAGAVLGTFGEVRSDEGTATLQPHSVLLVRGDTAGGEDPAA